MRYLRRCQRQSIMQDHEHPRAETVQRQECSLQSDTQCDSDSSYKPGVWKELPHVRQGSEVTTQQNNGGLPRSSPFLVKLMVPARKLTRQPTVSPGPYFGPYALPELAEWKTCPSSPWYPYDSGSQPGALDNDTVLPEHPTTTVVLHICQSITAVSPPQTIRLGTHSACFLDIIVTSK
jgi:hypothetical protein